MIDTAKSTFFVSAIIEMGSAVGAIGIQNSNLAITIAKGYKILAKKAQTYGSAIWSG
jgi:hypothetical protein